MKRGIIFVILLAIFGSIGFAQEINFSGTLGADLGCYAPGTENAGDFSIGEIDFTGAIEAYAGNGTLFIEGNVENDFISDSFSFDLSEAYLDYSDSFWGVRIGQQEVAWGKADGISITNSVFPEDSSSLNNDDNSVAIKALRLSLNGNSFTVDGFVIPFFTGTKLPLEKNNPLKKAILPDSVKLSQNGTDINLPINIGELSNPELNLKNMEYGLKASGYFSVCDFSLYGFYGWDKTPVLSYQINTVLHPVYNVEVPESLTVNGEYKRLGMAGFDMAVPVGPVVLRGESAFFFNRAFQARSSAIMNGKENFVNQNQLMALAGFDWMPSGWTITAQYYCDLLFSKSDEIERTETFEHGATLSISKSLLNDTLDFSFSGLVGLNDFDSALSASTKYKLTDQIGFTAGTNVFLPGREEGTYGKFKDLSSIYLKAEYNW
ncbi:MAG: hypothetical protein MJ174_10640 [Treponema sp.]|nr:hypothetical protein [Treponema sp.]